MRKPEILLPLILTVLGIGISVAATAAPLYFPDAPSWVWKYCFWGGISLAVLSILGALILIVYNWRIRKQVILSAASLIKLKHDLDQKERDAAEACGPNGSLGHILISDDDDKHYRPVIERAQSFFGRYGFPAIIHCISGVIEHLDQTPRADRRQIYEQLKALRNTIDGELEGRKVH